MLNAVGDDRMTAQKITVLLDKYKDSFGMIREVITEEVVNEAAGNEGCGDQIMTILLDRLKNEVCKSISPRVVKAAAGNQAYGEQIMTILLDQLKDKVRGSISEEVVKAAAGNWRYGAQITEKLFKICRDVVCENVSFAVICTAARNGQSGTPILELLLIANEEKVVKLISEVRSRAVKGEDCEKEVFLKLMERLGEIPYLYGRIPHHQWHAGRAALNPAQGPSGSAQVRAASCSAWQPEAEG